MHSLPSCDVSDKAGALRAKDLDLASTVNNAGT